MNGKRTSVYASLYLNIYLDFFRIFVKIVQIFVHLKKPHYKATAHNEWGKKTSVYASLYLNYVQGLWFQLIVRSDIFDNQWPELK